MSKQRRKQRQRAGARPVPAAAPVPRRAPGEERPPAPWGSFPLVELIVAVALVMLVVGFILGGTRGSALLGTGLVLGSLAGLELSVREHLAGYRSHTLLLAAAGAVATMLALAYLAKLSAGLSLAVAAAVFGALALLLTRLFRARTGQAFKLR
jgi:hypothetical protein